MKYKETWSIHLMYSREQELNYDIVSYLRAVVLSVKECYFLYKILLPKIFSFVVQLASFVDRTVV